MHLPHSRRPPLPSKNRLHWETHTPIGPKGKAHLPKVSARCSAHARLPKEHVQAGRHLHTERGQHGRRGMATL